MAQAGNRVVVVDTDLRHAMLHRKFDLPNREGLTNALMADEVVLDGLLQQTEVENLRVLTSGPLPPNASELLGSRKMRQLIARLKDEADIIRFDSPPALLVTDAAVLAMETDGVLVLAESGRTRRASLRQAIEHLQPLDVNIVGVVLNNIPMPRSKGYYYYQHLGEEDEEGPKDGVAPGRDAKQTSPTAETGALDRLLQLGARVGGEVRDRVPLGRREGE